MFIIEQTIDVKDAEEAKKALLDAIDEYKGGGFPIELSGAEPSQIALQLAIAGIREIEARGLDPMPGALLKSLLFKDVSMTITG